MPKIDASWAQAVVGSRTHYRIAQVSVLGLGLIMTLTTWRVAGGSVFASDQSVDLSLLGHLTLTIITALLYPLAFLRGMRAVVVSLMAVTSPAPRD